VRIACWIPKVGWEQRECHDCLKYLPSFPFITACILIIATFFSHFESLIQMIQINGSFLLDLIVQICNSLIDLIRPKREKLMMLVIG